MREVLSGRVGRRPTVVARSSSGALPDGQLFTPSYSGSWLFFGFSRSGDAPGRSRYVRARLTSGRLEEAVAPFRLTAMAREGDRIWYSMADGEFPGCTLMPPPGSPQQPEQVRCQVRLADPPAFRPYRRTRFGPGYGPP